jgi:thiol-disulfide isomerase/thioredoxin
MDNMQVWKSAASLIAAAVMSAAVFAADIPRPAPELVAKLSPTQDLVLSKYRGKVIALEFILTTCPHCQRTARVLSKLNQELGSRGFQPLGVAINDMAHMLIPDFVRDQQVNYPVAYAHRDTAIGFLQHPIMMSLMMPQIVFIDRKGVIRGQYAGTDKFFLDEEKNIRETVLPLLNEPATAARPAGKSSAAAKKKTS